MQNQKILNEMVNDYKQFDEVEAIVLGGSSAVKSNDNKSDFDLYIYCTKELRKNIQLIQKLTIIILKQEMYII